MVPPRRRGPRRAGPADCPRNSTCGGPATNTRRRSVGPAGKLRRRHGLLIRGKPREPGYRVEDWTLGGAAGAELGDGRAKAGCRLHASLAQHECAHAAAVLTVPAAHIAALEELP